MPLLIRILHIPTSATDVTAMVVIPTINVDIVTDTELSKSVNAVDSAMVVGLMKTNTGSK